MTLDAARRSRFDVGPVMVGLVLVALGGLFLLDQAGSIDAGQIIGDWWPLAIIAVGLAQLAAHPRSPLGPLIVAAFGGVLLFTQLELISAAVAEYLWPAALMMLGLVILLRRPGRQAAGTGEEVVSASAVFGSHEVVVNSKHFRGGSATAIFGGVVVDLRGADLDADGATLAVMALFGGVEILVPRGWRVEASGTPIFGGLSNKVEARPANDAPRLGIDVMAIFGGVDIKHER
jgi:predicted membrane protein